jgi:hypothetical protein
MQHRLRSTLIYLQNIAQNDRAVHFRNKLRYFAFCYFANREKFSEISNFKKVPGSGSVLQSFTSATLLLYTVPKATLL